MSNVEREYGDVALVIATFRQDEPVLRLLEDAFDADNKHPFAKIAIVDSLGSGAIERAIEERGWERVTYHNADHNLGSAGNLAMRLELAAQDPEVNWAYALNHDGELQWEALLALVSRGRAQLARGTRVGALYPLRYTTHLQKYNLTGRTTLPIPYVGTKTKPTGDSFRVYWASSNGALYATSPVREGLGPWPDLWMGWEDLGYGWQLDAHGWHQEVVCDAIFEDGYEYTAKGSGAAKVQITDKPTWYAYYQLRNLMLVAKRNERGPLTWSVIAGRVALEFGLSLTLRPDRARRIPFLLNGIADGLSEQSGKWLYP